MASKLLDSQRKFKQSSRPIPLSTTKLEVIGIVFSIDSWAPLMGSTNVLLDLNPDFSLHVRVTTKGRHTSFLQDHAYLLCIFSDTVTVTRKMAIAPHPALSAPKSAESYFWKHIACPGCLGVDKDKAVGRPGSQSPLLTS